MHQPSYFPSPPAETRRECKPPVSKRELKLNRRSSVETQRTNRGGCELPANKRELKFNLSSFMPSEKVVALELLIEVPEANSTPLQGYNITFYEFQHESSEWGFLATHPIIYNTSAEWLTFNLINVNHSDIPVRENYRLKIELTGKNLPPDAELISLLDNLAFKLVTFTYDNQSLEHLAVPSGMGEAANKKKRAAPTRLQTLAMQECSVQFHLSSYRELGWPGSDVHVITPTNANFSFCHGHCNSPYGDNHQIYTGHAQITEFLNLSGERRTPPPCCTPTKLIPENLIYMRDTIISMTYVQSVESCGCQ